MAAHMYDTASTVESYELSKTGRSFLYPPTEKIKVIEVENFPLLGKLTAFRFIEWVLKNPDGVISLPTGKTPEHFIKWVMRILERWDQADIRTQCEAYGIPTARRPVMDGLRFVQIDEFYPMDATQQNSFNWYVNELYLKGFGLRPKNALLIDATSLGLPPGVSMQEMFPNNIVDLSLRVRQTRTNLERRQKEAINRVDEFCMDYEKRIHEMGGIGFFLGGIGPDGHIAFNVRGSSVFSVTRLTGTNYETQAAAASDLGGIEISRSRLVITIGLATITYNPTVTAIVIAAGDAKAPIVADAIENKPSPQYPASVLQSIEGGRMYLTKGAASRLVERRFEDFRNKPEATAADIDDIVVQLAVHQGKRVTELQTEDFAADRFASELLTKSGQQVPALVHGVAERLVAKIERGLAPVKETVFLHTEPHHDDIMLGYLAHIYHLVRDPSNKHYFANLTSGFTAVSNPFCHSVVRNLLPYLESPKFTQMLKDGYFNPKSAPNKMEDVFLYLDGVAANNVDMKNEGQARRMLRNLIEVYNTSDMRVLRLRVRDMDEYFSTQYPGAKDPPDIQLFKGTIREYEVELLWAYFGIDASAISALRLGFYKGDIFSEEPEVDRDVIPIYQLIKKVNPTVVSVAFDPEGSGPDTHYKALQAVAEALRMYEKETGNTNIRVWGYRNVWYRYRPSEAELLIPVSLNSLSLLHTAFMNCFGSQSAASFPSYEHDGPFSELAQQIQVGQYDMMKTCLGHSYFQKHPHPRMRASRGMIFLKEMELAEFYEKVRELKKLTEAKD
ncbi:MAG: 6-phosphogluconolactonase [Ignavibacteriae bacterium]|nr:6-phosphogluconolactonase [Ignavibacteriota bacterium]